MIGGRVSTLWAGFCTKGLMVVLVLGIMTAHVPFPALARMSTDDYDSLESCGACECGPNESVARQVSSGEPKAAPPLKHSERETPNDDPCCPNGCTHCALPCCGGVTFVIALSATSPDSPCCHIHCANCGQHPFHYRNHGRFSPPARLIFL